MTAPEFYNDLDASLAEAWRLIADGVSNRKAPFHTPTVASVDAEGAPRLRTVVLRKADADARWLQFHTDCRSGKLAELARDPRVAVHLYDPEAKVQLRLRGRAAIHGNGPDPVADAAWAATRSFSRACYRIQPGPGTPLEQPDGYAEPEPEDPEVGREIFRVVRVYVSELEWLYLHAHGHRRALFAWDGEGTLAKRWLTP
jgi:hypothetical protein